MHPEENTPGPSGMASAAQRRRIVLSDSEDDAVSQHSSDDGSSSDSSTSSSCGGRPQCCICLNKLSRREVASPELCDHLFCVICLQSWAEGKKEATCPIDRRPFTLIKVRSLESNSVLHTLPVNPPKEASAPVDFDIPIYNEDDFNTYCEVCRECDREAAMLLCDSCDCGYHMDCLQPALEVVPVEEWFCPTCSLIVDTTPAQEASSGQSSRSRAQDRDARSSGASVARQRGGRRTRDEVRVLPRTREVERVRKRVRRIRETKAGEGQAASSRKKRKKARTAEQQETSEARDKFTSSIIPALSMVRDWGDDIDGLYNEDSRAKEFLERFGKPENRLSVSTAARIFRGAVSVPRPTYCGRSKIEERVETCSSSASVGLLDVLLDSQSTLLNKQIDINEERKLVARGKKRELADSDDESLRCMKRPLPSVQGEIELLQQKNNKFEKKDEEISKDQKEKDVKKGLESKESVQPDKTSDLKVEDRSSLESRRYHKDDRGYRSSNHYDHRKKGYEHDSYSRSKNGHHGYSSGYHSDRRSLHDRRDFRRHGNRHETSRTDEKFPVDFRERGRSRHDRHERESDTKHRSAKGDGDHKRPVTKNWSFGSFRRSNPSSSDVRQSSNAAGSGAPQVPASQEKEGKKYSQHTMTLPKALLTSASRKPVRNVNEGAQDAVVATSESKPTNGKQSKLIELFGDDTDFGAENEADSENPNQFASSPSGSTDCRKTNNKSLIKSSKDRSPLSFTSHAASLSDSDKERSSNDEIEPNSSKTGNFKNNSGISSDNSSTGTTQNQLDYVPSRAPDASNLNITITSQADLDTLSQQTQISPTASVSPQESSSPSTHNAVDSKNSQELGPPTSLKKWCDGDCLPTATNSQSVACEKSTSMSNGLRDNLCPSADLNPRDAARMQRNALEKVPAVSMPVFNCVKKAHPPSDASDLLRGHEAKNKEKLLNDVKTELPAGKHDCVVPGSSSKSANHPSPSVAGAVPLDKGSVAAVVKKRLDPVFQAKEISKQSYKEIVSKCVHKIIEKDTGTQVPINKIIELVEKYLEFYQHKERKDKKSCGGESVPL